MRQDIAERLDKVALGWMNRQIPSTLQSTYQDALPFTTVLERTRVNVSQTAVSQLTAPGTHTIWLDTPTGELICHIKTHLAVDPAAPLLLYHHGLNEYPYDSSWRRMFAGERPFTYHRVLIQAPYHDAWMNPLAEGFRTLQNIYQMLAGSLRMMALVQDCFEAEGAAFTAAAGVSWGGITSLLYEGLFLRSRAVIPMLASPHIARAIWDITELVARPLTITQTELNDRLDFTPLYNAINHDRVYPLLGEQDQFFRLEHHAPLYAGRPLVTIPGSHITNLWRIKPLRDHLLQTLASVRRE